MPLNPTKQQVCLALSKSIEEKTIDEVMSNELMATIRNANDKDISTKQRWNLIDLINSITQKEKDVRKTLEMIDQDISCGYKPKKYMVTKLSADEDYQRYMDIIYHNKTDPRVIGNR